MSPSDAYDFGAAVLESLRGIFGRASGAFDLNAINSEPITVEVKDDDGEMVPEKRERFSIRMTATKKVEGGIDSLADAIVGGDATFKDGTASMEDGVILLSLDTIRPEENDATDEKPEIADRVDEIVDGVEDRGLMEVSFDKLVEVASARPVNITIPSHAIVGSYSKREYEYFFSSQIIQMATDVFGIGIVFMLVYLERRGTIHRYGAEEDDNR